MLKPNGRKVVKVWFVFMIAFAATASAGVASLTSSFQVMWTRAIHDSALGGCVTGISPCADPEDDLSDPQGDEPSDDTGGDAHQPFPSGKPEEPDGFSCSSGPGLHVNIANGNVWTSYHVFSTYGAGNEAMSVTLTYNSLLSNEEAGINDPQARLGHGWRHSEDLGYFRLPAIVDGECYFGPAGTQCVLGEAQGFPPCTREDGPVGGNCVPPGGTTPVQVRCLQGCACHEREVSDWICGQTLTPERVVVVDGDGRQRVFYLGSGSYGSPPWQDAVMLVATPTNGGETGVDDLVMLYPNGSKRFFGFNGRVTRTVTARGLTTRFNYDTSKPKRLISQIDGFGRKVEFEYDEIDVGGGVYHGRLAAIVHPDNTTQNPVRTELHYENSNDPFLLTSIEDPTGELTQFQYEANPYPVDHDNNPSTPDRLYHRMTKETVRNGRIFSCQYVDTETLDKRTITAFDPDTSTEEEVLRIESEMFPEHRNQESDTGVQIQFFDGRSNQWTYTRNHWYQLTYRTLYGNASYGTTVDYDVIPTFDPNNPEASNPKAGRSTEVYYPLGLYKSFGYKLGGRVSTELVKVPVFAGSSATLDYLTTYQYSDDFPGEFPAYYAQLKGLPVWKQQPNGGIWEYEYNDKGDVTLIKDPIEETPTDGVQAFQYDYFGDEESLPPNVPTGTKLPGRLKEVRQWDRRGYKTVHRYNGQGHLTTKEVYLDIGANECITTEYGFDTLGRRTSETIHRGDSTTGVTVFVYDVLGRKTHSVENYTTASNPDPDIFNLTTEYGYDEHGNMTSMVNPRGTRTEYVYDHRNRLEKVIEDADQSGMNLETNYILDGNGNIETMIDAEENVTEFEYDAANFAIKITDPEGYHTKFQRDPKGNIEKMWRQRKLTDLEASWELTETTIYDGLSRIHKHTPIDAATIIYDYGYGSTGGGSGCGCAGFGSSIPYRVFNEDLTVQELGPHPGITYTELDLLGRVTQVTRKVGGDSGGSTPDSNDSATTYSYDPEGNLEQIAGPVDGEVTTMTYDGAGRMRTRTIEASPFDDLTTIYDYNGVGNVKQITRPTSHVTHYEYDEADRLERVYDAEGEIAFYTRDANGNVLTHADGNGNAWTYEYDALDRMTEMQDPLVESPIDGVVKFKYDDTGNLVERENRNVNQDIEQGPLEGVKTRYIYDKNDRLYRVVEDYVEAEYDDSELCGTPGYGELLDESGEGGTQGGGVLQGGGGSPGGGGGSPGGGGGPSSGLSSCSFSTANTVTTYEYDGRHLVKIFDHDCNVTEYFYDIYGRYEGATYPAACGSCPTPQIKFSYSGQSRKYFTRIDQRNFAATYLFDELGRLVSRKYEKQGATYRTEEFEYDLKGRLKTASGTYDPDGPFTAFSTIPLVSWEREYDKAGRPMSETQTHPGTTPVEYETTISYVLNSTDKTLTQEMCYPGCGQRIVSRVWDGRGRLKSANAGTGIGVDWLFDDGDRRVMASRRHPQQNSSAFGYDINDRMTSIVHSTGPAPEPPAVAEPSFSISYGYDPEGIRTYTHHSTQDYADRGEAYGHDNRLRLTKMTRGALTENSNGEWKVEQGDFIDHPTLASRQEWVGLDRRGNWLDYREAHSFGSTNAVARYETRVANSVNAYTSINPDCTVEPEADCQSGCITTATPTYDVSGNITFEPLARVAGHAADFSTAPNQGPGQEYEYDVENRLVRIRRDTTDKPGRNMAGTLPELNTLMEFTYDAVGRRVETIEYIDAATGQVMDGAGSNPAPRKTRHVYLGLEVIQEYVCGGIGFDSCITDPEMVREFVHGDPDRYPETVAMIDHYGIGRTESVPTGGFVYHYLHDVLGSVIGLVDESGALRERYTYDPYGKVFIEKWDATANGGAGAWLASAEPTSGLPVSSVGNPFMWTGHRYDAAVGLYATHFRAYSATLGRWLQRDPIEYGGGSPNLFEYALSSPLFLIDPLGLFSWVLGLHSDTGASGGMDATDGHAWITLTNTDTGAHLTYGLWPDGHPGVQQAGLANGPGSDVRVNFPGDLNREMDSNDAEIYWEITDEQARQVIKYSGELHVWEYRNNCSRFAGKCVETVLGIRVEAYDGRVLFFRTPSALARWIKRELKKREAEEKRKKKQEEQKKKDEHDTSEKDDTCKPKDPSDSGGSQGSGSGQPDGSSG